MIEQQITHFAEETAEGELPAVVEIWHAVDAVRGGERPEFKLNVLVRRELEFELGLAAEIAPCLLAKACLGVEREFLLAFQADSRAGGEAEHVFCLDVAPHRRIVLRMGSGKATETTTTTAAQGFRPRRKNTEIAPLLQNDLLHD